MNEAKQFGASLGAERERRGISLDVVAEKTKVSASVLAGLEKGDLSRWPSGIFRRGFFRAYADAVGLDVEATLADFLRVFPDDGRPPTGVTPSHSATLRLALDEQVAVDARRLVGLAIDVLVVLGVVAVVAFGELASAPSAVGIGFAIVWHGAGVLLWGVSPGLRLTRPRLAVGRVAEALDVPLTALVLQEDEPVEAPRLLALPAIKAGPRGRVARRHAAVRQEREYRTSR